jgi:hypothetical protein
MNYDYIAIPDQDVPQAKDPLFQHLVTTYASETLAAFGRSACAAIYGPSGDVKWEEADPTYSLEVAKRGG